MSKYIVRGYKDNLDCEPISKDHKWSEFHNYVFDVVSSSLVSIDNVILKNSRIGLDTVESDHDYTIFKERLIIYELDEKVTDDRIELIKSSLLWDNSDEIIDVFARGNRIYISMLA